MNRQRGILQLAFIALLTACGSEYEPYTVAPQSPTPPLEALLVHAGANSTGTGTIAGSGIDCAITGATISNTCAARLDRGKVVTLTADATGSSTFLGWGDACAASGSSRTCTVTVSQALAVSASFAAPAAPPPTHLVTVRTTAGNSGSGSVSGPGISCSISGTSQSGDCSEELAEGAGLTLTAVAAGGGSFLAWGGACASAGAATCTITVNQAAIVEASFAAPPAPKYVVNVVAGPLSTGTGTVTAPGIACTVSAASQSGDCSEELVQGTQLTLVATGTGNSTFAGWGQACSQAGAAATCTITVSQAATVEASYVASQVPKYVVKVVAGPLGAGTGTVTGPGINCGILGASQSGDCSEELEQGTQLTLVATGNDGSTFAAWGQACSQAGAAPSCRITVSQTTTVEATFAAPPPPAKYVVQVVAGSLGTGNGTVTGPGIACTVSAASQSGDCSEEFAPGTQLTYVATGTGGSTFAGWGQACGQAGAAATCKITVSQAATIAATFAAPPPPNLAGFWSGTDAGTNIHYHITLGQSGANLSLGSCAPGDCRLISLSTIGEGWLGASYLDMASLSGSVSGASVEFSMNLGGKTVSFVGALISPTEMVGWVSGGNMPTQSLTLGKQ